MSRTLLSSLFIPLICTIASAQEVQLVIIDSLEYNPRSLSYADFDGDGWDDIFVGTDTGVVVVDPRNHNVLWYSQILRERITATAFYDINGDGAEEILVGTQQNGYWLNVIYGPDYSYCYRWGGYINAAINRIYYNSLNISVVTVGLYSIDPITWDYDHIPGISGNAFLMNSANIYRSYVSVFYLPPLPVAYYTGYLQQLAPDLTILHNIVTYDYFSASGSPHYHINFGISAGNLLNSPNPVLTHAVYLSHSSTYELAGMKISCFNDTLGTVELVRDSSYIISRLNLSNNWFLIGRLRDNSNDDICLITKYSNSNSIIMEILSGTNLRRFQHFEVELQGFDNPNFIDVLPIQFDELIFTMNNKIYLSKLEIMPSGIDENEDILPDRISLRIYPNPFNNGLNISAVLSEEIDIAVDIFNLVGQRVAHIYNGRVVQGISSFYWDATGVSSGIYFVVARNAEFATVQKVQLLK